MEYAKTSPASWVNLRWKYLIYIWSTLLAPLHSTICTLWEESFQPTEIFIFIINFIIIYNTHVNIWIGSNVRNNKLI